MEPARDRQRCRPASTSRTARRCSRASPATWRRPWRRSSRSGPRTSPSERGSTWVHSTGGARSSPAADRGGSGGRSRSALATDGADVAINYRRDEDVGCADRRRHRGARPAVRRVRRVGRRPRRSARRWPRRCSTTSGRSTCSSTTPGSRRAGSNVVKTEVGRGRAQLPHPHARRRSSCARPGAGDARRGQAGRWARRRRDDLLGRDVAPGRQLVAVQHGEGRARGAGDGAGQGGAAQRDPRQRGRAGARRDRDGPAAREGRDGRRGHPHARRGRRRSATSARPRRWPTSCGSSSGDGGRYVTGVKITVDGGTF